LLLILLELIRRRQGLIRKDCFLIYPRGVLKPIIISNYYKEINKASLNIV